MSSTAGGGGGGANNAGGGGSATSSSSSSAGGNFVDRIDPFAKRSVKKKQKKSQGSSRYRNSGEAELQALPLLKGIFY